MYYFSFKKTTPSKIPTEAVWPRNFSTRNFKKGSCNCLWAFCSHSLSLHSALFGYCRWHWGLQRSSGGGYNPNWFALHVLQHFKVHQNFLKKLQIATILLFPGMVVFAWCMKFLILSTTKFWNSFGIFYSRSTFKSKINLRSSKFCGRWD